MNRRRKETRYTIQDFQASAPSQLRGFLQIAFEEHEAECAIELVTILRGLSATGDRYLIPEAFSERSTTSRSQAHQRFHNLLLCSRRPLEIDSSLGIPGDLWVSSTRVQIRQRLGWHDWVGRYPKHSLFPRYVLCFDLETSLPEWMLQETFSRRQASRDSIPEVGLGSYYAPRILDAQRISGSTAVTRTSTNSSLEDQPLAIYWSRSATPSEQSQGTFPERLGAQLFNGMWVDPPPCVPPDHRDFRMFHWLARGQDATKGGPRGEAPYVRLMEVPLQPSREDRIRTTHEINQTIRKGQAILLSPYQTPFTRGWELYDVAELTGGIESFHSLGFRLGAEVEWCSTKQRVDQTVDGSVIEMCRGTIAQFLEAADSADDSVGLSLRARYSEDLPWFIRAVSSDVHALRATAELSSVVDQDASFTVFRPAKLDGEPFNSQHWSSLSSPGFLSEPHHNPAGYCTWATAATGAGVWSYSLPVSHDPSAKARFEAYCKMLSNRNSLPELSPELATVHNIILRPGTVLIQPPDAFSQMYALDKTIVLGGHFINNDSLHLTEWARVACLLTKSPVIGGGSRGFLLLLSRIVYNWALHSPIRVPRRQYLAAARILLSPRIHLTADLESPAPGQESEAYEQALTEDTRADIAVAASIIRCINDYNDIHPSQMEYTDWILPGLDSMLWSEWVELSGDEINVPDIRGLVIE